MRRSGWAPVFALVPVVAALTAGIVVWHREPAPPPAESASNAALRRLAVAVGDARVIDARLTGGFSYAPAVDATRGTTPVRWPPAVRSELAAIEARFDADDSASKEAVWAAASLVEGDVPRAVALFDSVTSRIDPALPAGERASMWSNAAATYLTAAATLGRHELWIKALDAAEQARTAQPGLAEAAFNRAASLEGLALTDQARAAWAEYLRVDARSRWAEEARQRLQFLDRKAAEAAQGQAFIADLNARLPEVTAEDRQNAARFRQDLRVWIERTLLPAWGGAVLSHDGAAAVAALGRARAAAELLRSVGGDPLPQRAVAAAERATDQRPTLVEGLAAAHARLPAVMQLSDDGAFARASTDFGQLYPMFQAAGSPYAALRWLYLATDLYLSRRLEPARSSLARMDTASLPQSHLTGMRDWMSGLLAISQNHPEEARARYRDALTRFELLGEADSAGRMSALLAEAYAALGDRRTAWDYQRRALAQLPLINVPRRKHLILQLGGLLSLGSQASYAALAFQDAVIATARLARDRPASLVEGYLNRARTYARLQQADRFHADLESARGVLPAIHPDVLRASYGAEIDSAAADSGPLGDDGLAAAAATRALDYYGETNRFRQSGLHLRRGVALLRQDLVDRAAADFTAAIELFEALRRSVLEQPDRVRLFRDGIAAYSAMVRLMLEHRGDPTAALDVAERARARTLLEDLVGATAGPMPVADLPARLSPDTAVLFYATETDRLWLWAITRDGIQFVERPVAAGDLQFRVGRVRRLLTTPERASAADDRLLAHTLTGLFTDLLEPVRAAVASATSIVIIPDGPLHELPFAALIDPRDGRFLAETHILELAPSLSTFRRALAEAPPEIRQVLAIGDPAPADVEGAPPRLPFARAEVATVARLYPRTRVLTDRGATVDAVLAGLSGADVIHYAGHAVVDEDRPDRSHLLLSADPDHPLGLLFVDRLRRSMLPRRPLVVLAACSTNRGPVEVGEGVLSLARPFLAAGARTVVATLWDVEDRASAGLFERFHQRVLGGEPPARALAEAQRAVLGAGTRDVRGVSQWAWAVAIGGALR